MIDNLDEQLLRIKEEQFASLNELQFGIFKDVVTKFTTDVPRQIHLIKGSAGTGKTYSANKAIEYIMEIQAESNDKTITVAAPTNQAVNNIYMLLSDRSKALAEKRKYINYKTLHSFLGYEEVIDGFGNKSFKQSVQKKFVVEERLSKTKLLVIDEGSMIPKQMYEILVESFLKYKFHIFFIGDPYQLPPVNEPQSLVFDKKEIAKLKLYHTTTTLTEIIRQRHGHPILDVTKHYTHSDEPVDLLALLKKSKTVLNESAGLINLNNNNAKDADLEKMTNILAEYYISEKYKLNPIHIKTIAYTNNCVDSFNDVIRSIIYGEEALIKLVVGEKLILNAPVCVDKKSNKFLHVNQEITVEDYSVKMLDIEVGSIKFKMQYYDTEISYQNLFTTDYARIKILHESAENQMKKKLEEIKTLALKYPKGGIQAKIHWVNYYKLKDKFFTDVKYAYCVTTHKAQGSTYDNIILVVNDLNKNRIHAEKNKLVYTAMTRAKYNLILINE